MPADPVRTLAAALADAAGAELELERPGEAAHGDYATNVALQLAGTRRQPPREIAEEIAEAAAGLDGGRACRGRRARLRQPLPPRRVVRDGARARSSRTATRTAAACARARGARPGRDGLGEPDRARSASRSARNGAYGDAVARLLELAGHEVEREYYYNDSGAQMDRFRASVEAVRRGEEPPEDGYRGEYIAELARAEGDPVPLMLRADRGVARALPDPLRHAGAGRASSSSGCPSCLPRLDTYEKEGALWARSSAYGDDEDRVLLRSGDRTPTYRAADVAYLVDKLERGFDRAIYVLGADHHGTRNWYAAVARMLGYDPERVEVLLYQLVHLTRGGEQTKMSKRRGDVVFLDDFMDEIGVDAARWYLVNRGPDQTIEIDVDLAAERSQKNPVYYVQYAHARIAGHPPQRAGQRQ